MFQHPLWDFGCPSDEQAHPLPISTIASGLSLSRLCADSPAFPPSRPQPLWMHTVNQPVLVRDPVSMHTGEAQDMSWLYISFFPMTGHVGITVFVAKDKASLSLRGSMLCTYTAALLGPHLCPVWKRLCGLPKNAGLPAPEWEVTGLSWGAGEYAGGAFPRLLHSASICPPSLAAPC